MGELSPYFIRRIGVPLQPPQPGEPFNEAAEVAGIEPGFWDFWRVIRKHKKLIAMFFVSVVLTVSIGTLLMTPIYTSRTTILIEQKTPTFINIQQAMSESLGTEKHDYYQTQYEILKSPTLAAQVIHELDLKNNKVFTGAGDEGLADKLRTLVKGWLGAQRWARELFSSAKETQVPDASNLSLINHYVNDYLEIKPVESTQLVNITFSTPDRNLSAELANAHTQAYIRQGLKLRTRTNEEAQQFLKQRLVELKDRVKKSEEALNNYRREKGIISLDDKENVVIDRLSDLNKRLTEAEAERIALGAQVKLIHQRTYDSLPAVISNELIQKLKEQLSRLEGEYANLAAEYNLGYPRLAQVKAQLDESRKRLKDEIRGVVQGIESAYLAAESREKGLREKMRQQRNAALKLKDASVEYAILSQEADTNRQLYNSVLQRMKEMGVATEMRTSNVFVVDTAKPALNPSRPKKTLNLLLGAIIGLMGGVALAFLFEYLDNTVRTPDDVENYVHLPTLSVIPDLTIRLKEKYPSHRGLIAGIKGNGWGEAGRAFSKELVLSHHPHSLATESYRSLQTSILLSQAGEPPRTLLFTSGCLGEGKTASPASPNCLLGRETCTRSLSKHILKTCFLYPAVSRLPTP
jgi:succinoglycan biosynthesis transport protein ExoP